MSSNEKKAKLPPRAWYSNPGGNEIWDFWNPPEYASDVQCKIIPYISLAEHQSLLTAADEKLRIAREALDKVTWTHVQEVSNDRLVQQTNIDNLNFCKQVAREALAKLGGADERSG